MEQLTVSGLRKEQDKAAYCNPVYLTYTPSMRNARLDELQAGIKLGERKNNSLRYVGDSTLMAESKEELKSLLMRVKEESEKASLRVNI